jgi:hypothetical protein
MTFNLDTRPGRSGLVRVGLAILVLAAGCFATPDVSRLTCKKSDQCPPSYQCNVTVTPGRCCKPNDAICNSSRADASSPTQDGHFTPVDATGNNRNEVALPDGIASDSSTDAGKDQPSNDVPPSPETGTSDSGGTGPEIGPDSPLAPDAPSIDATQLDAPDDSTDLTSIGDAPSLGPDAAGSDSRIDAGPDTTLSGAPPGATCSKAAECASNNCSDGVCCDLACTGSCQSCALSEKVGTCSLVTGVPASGHPPCGGSGYCAGSCNGQSSSCYYPGVKTTCATAACINGSATPARACDGAGNCSSAGSIPCGAFICGTAACLSSCTDNSQCVSGAACVSGRCTVCSTGQTVCPNLCTNLQSDDSHCGACSGTGSACSATQQCTGGKCLLASGQGCTSDAQCAVGKCALFYLDIDNDQYPSSQNSAGWCGATYPLAAGYIAPRADGKWDCCDNDLLVHPDQAEYFTVSTTSCSVGFDYDCSGSIEKQPMAGSEPCAFDASQVCGSATGTPSEACGSLHRAAECEAVTTVNPPLCVSTTSMVGGTVGCH